MHSANKRVFFGNYVFEVCENVYEPAEDSFLFADRLQVLVGTSVLDMGTGTGILGVSAAGQAREVLSVDVNPFALRCAKKNAELNQVRSKMNFLQGNLFSPLSETAKFDLVLFNAPYLPSEPGEDKTWLGRAWAGGPTGRNVIDRFISEAPSHLEKAGTIFLMQSSLANVEETVSKFSALELRTRIVTELALPFFEKLVLLKATF